MFTQLGLHLTRQGMMTVLARHIVEHCFSRFLLHSLLFLMGVVDDKNTLYLY